MLFRGLNLEMQGGGALHITGTNGIGKTSLMRILAGLLNPFEGSTAHTGTLAMVDEKAALDPQLALGNALKFWASMDGHEDIAASCGAMGIADLLDVPIRFLSTGQRKRAAFARMLNQNAQIWLLDEPLNGLDDDGVAKIEGLIAAHCGSGGICIAASHQSINLPDAKTLALGDYTA